MNDHYPLLAVDTVSTRCSVALSLAPDEVFRKQGTGQKRHALEVLSLVDEVLTESGTDVGALQAMAVISGPGSFTGLRIGASVVQGLAFAAQVPVVQVSSLALLAMAAREQGELSRFCCLIRARPGEYYHASYCTTRGLPELSGQTRVGRLDDMVHRGDERLVCDADTAAVLQAESRFDVAAPKTVVATDAGLLARLAARMIQHDPETLMSPSAVAPVYIKDDLEYRKSGMPID